MNVVPTEGNELNDSIPSVIEKGNFLKYHITSIKIEQENTPKDALIQLVMGIIAIPFSLITLGALYCFIRLILSIRKKDLFNPSNVFRVRLISATIRIPGRKRTDSLEHVPVSPIAGHFCRNICPGHQTERRTRFNHLKKQSRL